MSKSVEETRRELFEAWFKHNYSWYIAKDLDGYSFERYEEKPNQYVNPIPHHDWRVFNAALDAVEIDLQYAERTKDGGCISGTMWTHEVHAAIKLLNLGLKIK